MQTKRLIFFLFFSSVCLAGKAQTLNELLDLYVQKTGGVEKWRNVKTIVMKGYTQDSFRVMVYHKVPNKKKMVVYVQGKEMVPMAFDGQTAWEFNPFTKTGLRRLDKEQTKALQEERVENDLIDYAKKGYAVTLLAGKEEVSGISCYRIKLEKHPKGRRNKSVQIYYLDAENYILVKTIVCIDSGYAAGVEVETYFSDYRETEEGLLMPHCIEQKIKGKNITRINLESILLNEPLDDSVFAYPGK